MFVASLVGVVGRDTLKWSDGIMVHSLFEKECIAGIKIIQRNHFPIEIINEETGEVEDVIHMVQKDDKIYVSEELFTAIRRSFDE